ncbi:hypothetical protein PVAP13_5NG169981 [Panicum virgatum]|uniref:Uncharacterized protein n=1 Tax=Panicum virgatum TaxID=38727 RepID=A0A8T0RSW2_PANVG|nr:hypothetical protein PVAP13_5NG169981 [Panicum virgatum]
MWHEYMHKTPLKLISSTFSPLPPVLSLSLSPCLPCFASELAAAALPPRLPLELADAAAPRSSRTSLPPGARGLRAHRRPWSSRPPPLARRSNSRAMCGGDGACGLRPRGHGGGRQTPPLSRHYLRANVAPPRHARRRRRCLRLLHRRRRRSSRPPHAPRQHGSQLPRRRRRRSSQPPRRGGVVHGSRTGGASELAAPTRAAATWLAAPAQAAASELAAPAQAAAAELVAPTRAAAAWLAALAAGEGRARGWEGGGGGGGGGGSRRGLCPCSPRAREERRRRWASARNPHPRRCCCWARHGHRRHGRAEASASAAPMEGGGGGRGRRIHLGLLPQHHSPPPPRSLAAGAMVPPWPLPPWTCGGRGLTGGAGVAGGGALARSPSPRALQLLAGEGKEEGRAGTEEERRAGSGRSGAQVGGSPEVGVRHGGRRLAEAGARCVRQPCLLSLKDVKVEDDKTQGPFCIYSCPLKGYGPKWHNLTSSGS